MWTALCAVEIDSRGRVTQLNLIIHLVTLLLQPLTRSNFLGYMDSLIYIHVLATIESLYTGKPTLTISHLLATTTMNHLDKSYTQQ